MSLKHILLDIFEMIFGAACHIYTVYELNTSHTIHDNHPLKFARP